MFINVNNKFSQNTITFKANPVTITKPILQRLTVEGKKLSEIAEIMGTTENVVSSYLKKYGLKIHFGQNTKKLSVELVENYLKDGITIEEIAKRIGYTKHQVRRYAQEHNIIERKIPYVYKNKGLIASEEEVKKLLEEGKTITDLSKIYECSKLSVRAFLEKHSLKTKDSAALARVKKEHFQSLLDLGKSQGEIAQIYGIEPGSVSCLYRKFGIKKPSAVILESLTKEEAQELLVKYPNYQKLAQYFGTSRITIRKIFEKLDVVPKIVNTFRHLKTVNVTKEDMQKLIEQGYNLKEIEKHLGIGRYKLLALLDSFGLKTKSILALEKKREARLEIQKLIGERKTVSQIAKELNKSESSVYEQLHNMKLTTLNETRNLRSIGILKDFAKKGLTVDEMALNLKEDGVVLDEIIRKCEMQVFHHEKFNAFEYEYERDIIEKLIKNGSSSIQIAELYGVSSKQVKTWLDTFKIAIPKDKKSPTREQMTEILENLIKQKRKGGEYIDWSKQTGFSKYTIEYLVKKYQLETLFSRVQCGV